MMKSARQKSSNLNPLLLLGDRIESRKVLLRDRRASKVVPLCCHPATELVEFDKDGVDGEGGEDEPPFVADADDLEDVVVDDGDVDDREDAGRGARWKGKGRRVSLSTKDRGGEIRKRSEEAQGDEGRTKASRRGRTKGGSCCPTG
jgi:hypothetical protein